MVSQAIGLASAVGFPFEVKTIYLRAPWRWLPGHWAARLGAFSSLDSQDNISSPWPDLLITCGRRSVAIAIAIRELSQGHTFTVHIQDPRVPTRYFDMVVPPEHDHLVGANVFPTKGALHKLTREILNDAAAHFRELFSTVNKPFVAVLIGGKSKAYQFSATRMQELATQLKSLVNDHSAGLVITTSRRTGAENTQILHDTLADTDAVIVDETGENPYLGMLALADSIIVTEDSVSMVSEACFTGKPVYIAKLAGGSKRFTAFHQSLQDAKFTRIFTGKLESWSYKSLDENQRIAAIIQSKLAKE